MAVNRVIVDAAVHDFVERFVERTRRMRVGDPLDDTTHIGPIINSGQLDTSRT